MLLRRKTPLLPLDHPLPAWRKLRVAGAIRCDRMKVATGLIALDLAVILLAAWLTQIGGGSRSSASHPPVVPELSPTILRGGTSFEGQENPSGADQARGANGRGSVLMGLLCLRSEHPE